MAGYRFLLILAAITGLLGLAIRAQVAETSPTVSPSPTPLSLEASPTGRPGKQRPLRPKAQERINSWQALSNDEQAHFRFLKNEREKRTEKAVDDTLRNSGLVLDAAEKQKFTEVYKKERRQLEEQLRAEMEQKRRERLPTLQKTVVEAYQKAAASPSPVPASPTATP
jgi:hypothetical protein